MQEKSKENKVRSDLIEIFKRYGYRARIEEAADSAVSVLTVAAEKPKKKSAIIEKKDFARFVGTVDDVSTKEILQAIEEEFEKVEEEEW